MSKNNTKVLGASDILAAKDLETVGVPCPEWGGTVLIKTMSGTERDAFEVSFTPKEKGEKADLSNTRARYVAASAVDENGELLFSSPDQVLQLGKKSAKALDRCFDMVRELNGMTEEAEAKAKKG